MSSQKHKWANQKLKSMLKSKDRVSLKVMLIVYFNIPSTVHFEFVLTNVTDTAEFYVNILKCLWKMWGKKSAWNENNNGIVWIMWNHILLLQHNNSCLEIYWQLPQPIYFPNFNPVDFYFYFHNWENFKRINISNKRRNYRKILRTFSCTENAYQAAFKSWVVGKRGKCSINTQGLYFKGDKDWRLCKFYFP